MTLANALFYCFMIAIGFCLLTYAGVYVGKESIASIEGIGEATSIGERPHCEEANCRYVTTHASFGESSSKSTRRKGPGF